MNKKILAMMITAFLFRDSTAFANDEKIELTLNEVNKNIETKNINKQFLYKANRPNNTYIYSRYIEDYESENKSKNRIAKQPINAFKHQIAQQNVNKLTNQQSKNPTLKYNKSGTNNEYTEKEYAYSVGQDVDAKTYQELLDSLNKGQLIREKTQEQGNINLYGELRYHYSFDRGDRSDWRRNQSGLRLYLGAHAQLNKDWEAVGVLELQKDIQNYNDKAEYNSLYLRGRLGENKYLTVGAFGYLMEEGNIYDSQFRGARIEFGDKIRYAYAYGNTKYTKDTTVFTAKYSNYDYDIYGGIYNFKLNDGDRNNTILTAGYKYYFSNFNIGILGLRSTLADAAGNKNGFVLGLTYNKALTYRPGTYEVFARYYNQPRWTYIDHGMNGPGTRMNGFKGYGIGARYVPMENTSVSLEYYNLKDKVSGERGSNVWLSMSYYFSGVGSTDSEKSKTSISKSNNSARYSNANRQLVDTTNKSNINFKDSGISKYNNQQSKNQTFKTQTSKYNKSGTNNEYTEKEYQYSVGQDVDAATYQELLSSLDMQQLASEKTQEQGNINIHGELRYHYSFDRGDRSDWHRNQSGLRLYLGAHAQLNKDWEAVGVLELQKDIQNYNDKAEYNSLYLRGRLGENKYLTVGAFGYLMEEGNIYDSQFRGARIEFGDKIRYAYAYGNTKYTKDTTVFTAKYSNYDYDIHGGIYNFKLNDGDRNNTILTAGYKYYFSNFNIGILGLRSTLADAAGNKNGFVLGLTYNKALTYRPGTYEVFARYYNQPRWTYIDHGMNGPGTRMNGFKGYGIGARYVPLENTSMSLEYYNLKDKISGERGSNVWLSVSYYFAGVGGSTNNEKGKITTPKSNKPAGDSNINRKFANTGRRSDLNLKDNGNNKYNNQQSKNTNLQYNKSAINNAYIEKEYQYSVGQDVDAATYQNLLASLDMEQLAREKSQEQGNINIHGELRYHYSFDRGDRSDWRRNQSGLRLYLGARAQLNKDWEAVGVLEMQKDIQNYNDKAEYNSLYLRGRLGENKYLTVGAFGYLMEEGNIYDSQFRGVRIEFGDKIRYAYAYGNTKYTKDTTVFTAKYSNYDYDIHGGIYNFKLNDGDRNNTILTAGYKYYFSNFNIGILGLRSTMADAAGNKNGFVLGLTYNKALTYRPGTYEVFARYYNQPRWTYIDHGMNGPGTRMNGFKGYGIGARYVPMKDVSVSLEYYNLKDKVSGERGSNVWLSVSYYFAGVGGSTNNEKGKITTPKLNKSVGANNINRRFAHTSDKPNTNFKNSGSNKYNNQQFKNSTSQYNQSGTSNEYSEKEYAYSVGQDVDAATYQNLLGSLDREQLAREKTQEQGNINIYGELRYHYSFDRGDRSDWRRNQSGLRLYLGAHAQLNKDWEAVGVLELQKDIQNYNDKAEYNSLYLRGRLGDNKYLTVGAFGYLMEEGNIYDSQFRGARIEFGDKIRYAYAYGNTKYTKDTTVFTAKYSNYDYDINGGIYNFKLNDGDRNNTILTAGYKYYFSNFNIGILGLRSTLADAAGNKNGFVLGLTYNKALTYRPGTYEVFARYYNQPRWTYIDHGMNGPGTRMNGFKGYGIGARYVPMENTSVSLEYYNLKDKVSGERGSNVWLSMSYYF